MCSPFTDPAHPTGRGISIAVIDSGVHAMHPHVQGVAGGISVLADGRVSDDYVDRIGHGTAVMAAIKEKAPGADLFAVRIFDRTLSARVDTLCTAVAWAIDAGMRVVNLSLGTANPAHREALLPLVRRANDHGTVIVAAGFDEGISWLPGSIAGVVPVRVDWQIPRDQYRVVRTAAGRSLRASGYPRTIPGVPARRNLSGISFAVANATGFVARMLECRPSAAAAEILTPQ
jgi:subtilisin family serine protease